MVIILVSSQFAPLNKIAIKIPVGGCCFVGSAKGEKAKSASEHAAAYGKHWMIRAQIHEEQLKGGIEGQITR